MITLHDFQADGLRRIHAAARDTKAILAVSPTGSGKTTMASEIVRRAWSKGNHALWLAHRKELVDQAYDRLAEFDVPCGVISASSSRPPNPYEPVQVASIQTLLARKERPRARVVIWDEAHHAPSDLWSELAADYADALLIGFTATPERSDGRGLGAIYKRIVTVATVKQLVELGHLVPCNVVHPEHKLRRGSIAQRPVDAWLRHAVGRPTVVFSPSIVAAEQHAEDFRAAGIRAEVVTGDTPAGERDRMLEDFKAGVLPVLVNVYVLTEGFDAPATSCVILARGCGTVGTYLQMVGRGLRTAPGKTDCLLIDLHGVIHVHQHPTKDRTYSLEGKGISGANDNDVDTGSSCRVCGAPIEPGEACGDCGTEPRQITPPKVTGDPLVKYASKRAEGEDKRAATLARWTLEGRAKGYKPGFARGRYKVVYGEPPTSAVVYDADIIVAEREAQIEAEREAKGIGPDGLVRAAS